MIFKTKQDLLNYIEETGLCVCDLDPVAGMHKAYSTINITLSVKAATKLEILFPEYYLIWLPDKVIKCISD